MTDTVGPKDFPRSVLVYHTLWYLCCIRLCLLLRFRWSWRFLPLSVWILTGKIAALHMWGLNAICVCVCVSKYDYEEFMLDSESPGWKQTRRFRNMQMHPMNDTSMFFSNQCSLASSSWGSQLLQLECYAAPRGEMKERRKKKTLGFFCVFFFFFYFRRAVMLVGWTCLKEGAVADELFCWLCRMVRDFSECKWWCRTLMEPLVQMKVHI